MADPETHQNGARVRGKGGRPKGSPNRITQDLREVIQQAFHKAGGRNYLVKVAQKRPDVFCALLGKIIPQETRLSVMASYQAMPIPVELRDSLPAIEHQTNADTFGDVFDAIGHDTSDPLLAPTVEPTEAEWL